jgi:hypothetical protein
LESISTNSKHRLRSWMNQVRLSKRFASCSSDRGHPCRCTPWLVCWAISLERE